MKQNRTYDYVKIDEYGHYIGSWESWTKYEVVGLSADQLTPEIEAAIRNDFYTDFLTRLSIDTEDNKIICRLTYYRD